MLNAPKRLPLLPLCIFYFSDRFTDKEIICFLPYLGSKNLYIKANNLNIIITNTSTLALQFEEAVLADEQAHKQSTAINEREDKHKGIRTLMCKGRVSAPCSSAHANPETIQSLAWSYANTTPKFMTCHFLDLSAKVVLVIILQNINKSHQ